MKNCHSFFQRTVKRLNGWHSSRPPLAIAALSLLCTARLFSATLVWTPGANQISVSNGAVTLSDIKAAIPGAPLDLVDPVNNVWLLRANLTVQNGATLVLHGSAVGGDVNELRLQSVASAAPCDCVVSLTANWGTLDVNGVRITSWDTMTGAPNTNYLAGSGRAHIAVFSGLSTNGVTAQNSSMNIVNSEICFLGDTSPHSSGVAWEVSGTNASLINGVQVSGNVINSSLHDNYIGGYTLRASGMQWQTNQIYNNTKYGLELTGLSSGFLIRGNYFTNNGAGSLQVENSGNNLFAGNTFTDPAGKLRFEGCLSNWLDGNAISPTMSIRTTGATNLSASTYVRNQDFLNVEVATNATTVFEDAQGRIYQPDDNAIQTAISTNGSVLTLAAAAGRSTTRTVTGRNFYSDVNSGTAGLNQLIWTVPVRVAWTSTAGHAGQSLMFRIGGLVASTNYLILRNYSGFTNLAADVTGTLSFSDTAADTNPAVYSVILPSALNNFPASIKYSADLNKLYVYGGGLATLSNIQAALPAGPLTLIDPTNKIWLLTANLIVQDGSLLILHGAAVGGDVNELRLLSLYTSPTNGVATNGVPTNGVVYVEANWGSLDINSTRITSWDTNASAPQTNYLANNRAYLVAFSTPATNGFTLQNSRIDITNSEICFLGDTNSNEQGLVWKVSGVDPNPTNNIYGVQVFGHVVGSRIHDNYIGGYTFGCSNMLWLGNQIYNNANYGLDLQDYSDGFLIQSNFFYNNGNHGLTVSVYSGQETIIGNVAVSNDSSGMELSDNSDGSLLASNQCLANGNSGIAIDVCASNTVLDNFLSGNAEGGLRLTAGSAGNVIQNNECSTNKYGLYCFPGTTTPNPGDDGHPKGNIFLGNLVHDNLAGPVLFTNSDFNTLANNSFPDLTNKLRFENSVSNWLNGNSISTNLAVRTEGDTNSPASTYVRNEPLLNVEVDENASVTFEDAQGRLFQPLPGDKTIVTTVSTNGSILTLTAVGTNITKTIATRDLFAGVSSGTAYFSRVTWSPPTFAQWTTTPGFIGQNLNFTIRDLIPYTGYVARNSGGAFTNLTSSGGAVGQLQFSIGCNTTQAVVYAVAIPDTTNSTPPFLPGQAEKIIYALQTLTVTNTGGDANTPYYDLAYSLMAPGGASISANGVITWTPNLNQAPSTNIFLTVVTDNGSPPLSGSNVFAVIVRDPLAPTLPLQPNVVITAGTVLEVTNTAFMPAGWTNFLTYQLTAPPNNAKIDPNGIITWPTVPSQGPSTNLFTTVVFGAGAPPVNLTNSFQVLVQPVPVQLQIVSVASNSVVLAWSTPWPGWTLQQAGGLGATNWVNMDNSLILSDQSQYQVTVTNLPQATFFRLLHP